MSNAAAALYLEFWASEEERTNRRRSIMTLQHLYDFDSKENPSLFCICRHCVCLCFLGLYGCLFVLLNGIEHLISFNLKKGHMATKCSLGSGYGPRASKNTG